MPRQAAAPAALPRVGLWSFDLDTQPAARAQELAAELEELGYAALWIPEAVGREVMANATLLLSATRRMLVGTGVANIYARDAMAMTAGRLTIGDRFAGRFVLGLGVSHKPSVEGRRGHRYGPPLATMRAYLEAMEEATFAGHPPSQPPPLVLGALGPRMLALAAEKTMGAHTYMATPGHTATARRTLGSGRWLIPEVTVLLESRPGPARDTARRFLGRYLELPNYANNLLRCGFEADDLTDGGSDRLVDALVCWGEEEDVVARVREHLDAGADHVAVQVLGARWGEVPLEPWQRLAPALDSLRRA